MKRFKTYTAFSVAVSIGWAVFLVVAATTFDSSSQFEKILLVFAGFVIGWGSATVARDSCPPPKKHRQLEEQPAKHPLETQLT